MKICSSKISNVNYLVLKNGFGFPAVTDQWLRSFDLDQWLRSFNCFKLVCNLNRLTYINDCDLLQRETMCFSTAPNPDPISLIDELHL
jgi:hypothetical protein